MASLATKYAISDLDFVNLSEIRSSEIIHLWDREVSFYRTVLNWDVSHAIRGLKQALAKGQLYGKGVRSEGSLCAYYCCAIDCGRAVISGFGVSHPSIGKEITKAMLEELVKHLDNFSVRRIESQFIGFDIPGLVECFEAEDFKTNSREFLRIPLPSSKSLHFMNRSILVQPFDSFSLEDMATLMHDSHAGLVDSEINELYATRQGCKTLLDDIVIQHGCGNFLPDASSIAAVNGADRAGGFAIVSLIGNGHGHLAQLAVAPEFQKQGVGRFLLDCTLAKCSELGLGMLSLMVSSRNKRAKNLYHRVGFETVYRFPVFFREN